MPQASSLPERVKQVAEVLSGNLTGREETGRHVQFKRPDVTAIAPRGICRVIIAGPMMAALVLVQTEAVAFVQSRAER